MIPSTAEELLLGTIHAPDAWGPVRPPTAGFAEYYGTVDACESLPHAVALLTSPRVKAWSLRRSTLAHDACFKAIGELVGRTRG